MNRILQVDQNEWLTIWDELGVGLNRFADGLNGGLAHICQRWLTMGGRCLRLGQGEGRGVAAARVSATKGMGWVLWAIGVGLLLGATMPNAQSMVLGVALADRSVPFGLLEPSGSVLVTTNVATVKGYHRFARPVAINGVRVTPRVDGRFSHVVPLSMGPNVIYVATTVPTQRDPVVMTRWVYRLPANGLPSYLLARAGIATSDQTVITRLDWAKLLWLVAPRPSTRQDPVTRWRDIPDSMREVVHSAVSQGLMGGVGDRFMPHYPMMQLDMLLVTHQLAGQGVSKGEASPKPGREWASRYAQLAVGYGLVKHTRDFQPNASVSRTTLLQWLGRLPIRSDTQIPPGMSSLMNRDLLATTKSLVGLPSAVGSPSSKPTTPTAVNQTVSTDHTVTVALDGHWVKESVMKLASLGVLAVWADGGALVVDRSFVKGPVLRGDFVDLLGILASETEVEGKDPVAIASQVFRAPSPTKWALSRRMTKGETITALVRWAGLPCQAAPTGVSSNITDAPHWSAPYVACAVQAGWLSATPPFSSKAPMTRAELFSVLLKIPSISQRVRHASTQP